MRIKFHNWHVRSVQILVALIPLVSLWVSTMTIYPFITGRTLAFRSLIEIAFGLWLILIIRKKEYRPRGTLLTWTLVGFLVIVAIANLAGINPERSFWSTFERMEGYILLLHAAAYFVILTTVVKTKKQWTIFFNLVALTGGIAALYALYQATQGIGRVESVLGNATFLASYLLIIAGIAALLSLRARKKWQRYGYGALIAISIIAMSFTGSRGPLFGLVIGGLLGVGAFIWASSGKRSQIKYAGMIAITIIAIPLLLFTLRTTTIVQNTPALSRLTSISISDNSISSRLIVWSIAWEGFKERPILGWGQENFLHVFNQHYDAQLFDREPWFASSHNTFIDWAINAGAIGFIAYIGIYIAAILSIKKAVQRQSVRKEEAAIVIAVIAGYATQNLFTFDNINTIIPVVLLLAYINTWGSEIQENTPSRQLQSTGTLWIASAIIIIATGIGIYRVNVIPLQHAYAINTAIHAPTQRENIQQLTEALSSNPIEDPEAMLRLSIALGNASRTNAITQGEGIQFTKQAAEELEKYIEKNPTDAKTRYYLTNLYLGATRWNGAFAESAKQHIDELLLLNNKRQIIHYALVDYYRTQGDVQKAIEVAQRVIELDPQFPETHAFFAIIAIQTGKDDLAERAIQEVEKRFEATREEFAQIGTAYISVGRNDRALELYKRATELRPNNALYHAITAELYLDQGFPEEARKEAEKARELNPEDFSEDVARFLQKLEDAYNQKN
jgi:O-antigen ligase/tetratricopeptide (TPR) repeat protein